MNFCFPFHEEIVQVAFFCVWLALLSVIVIFMSGENGVLGFILVLLLYAFFVLLRELVCKSFAPIGLMPFAVVFNGVLLN